jgi:hypothetical protein
MRSLITLIAKKCLFRMVLFTCKKCLAELEPSEFYRHRRMASGYLSFCKTCVIARVHDHRVANLEKVREYDRERGLRPDRKELARRNSSKNNVRRNIRAMRAKYPDRYAARMALGNAVRDGRVLKPDACERCTRTGFVLHGHHEDYSKPLDVNWLCVDCHGARHREINEERRASQRIAAE